MCWNFIYYITVLRGFIFGLSFFPLLPLEFILQVFVAYTSPMGFLTILSVCWPLAPSNFKVYHRCGVLVQRFIEQIFLSKWKLLTGGINFLLFLRLIGWLTDFSGPVGIDIILGVFRVNRWTVPGRFQFTLLLSVFWLVWCRFCLPILGCHEVCFHLSNIVDDFMTDVSGDGRN